MGVPVSLLKRQVTAPELQRYMAVALIDGPWHGTEAEAVYAASICRAWQGGKITDHLIEWDADKSKKVKLDWAAASAFLTTLTAK